MVEPLDPLAVFVDLAAQMIRESWPTQPQVGIILGTGLGQFAQQIDAAAILPYESIPGFPRTTAIGHRGRLICGRLGAIPVIAMEGRCHLYEGHSWADVTLPVRVMRRLGANLLIASNASGGVNPVLSGGDLVVITSHVNLLGRRVLPVVRPAAGNEPETGPQRPYDQALIQRALELARGLDIPAVPGVYVAMLGPNYETRAEYRLVRRIGGDVVGMSTVPEAIVGRQCGMRVLGLSVVTNVARPDALSKTSGQAVALAASEAESRLGQLVRALVADQEVAGPRNSS